MSSLLVIFCMSFDFMMFLVDGITKTLMLLFIDRAPVRPAGMSPIQHQGELRVGAGLSGIIGGKQGDTLDLLEEELIQLTVPILYTRDEDIPMSMRRHTRRDGGCFMWLLTQGSMGRPVL